MDIEEFINAIIANPTDTAIVTENLQRIREAHNEITTNFNTLNEQHSTLTADNERLKKLNLDYFIKLGGTDTNKGKKDEHTDTGRTFESLFDENGELK